MSLSFTQVVACNNLLALRSFSTFLFNYSLHESPNFIERLAIGAAEKWIELRARKEFIELKQSMEEMEDKTSINLKGCRTAIFTVLYLATDKQLTFSSGKDLFKLISDTELEFEKVKNPKEETAYATIHAANFGTDPVPTVPSTDLDVHGRPK